MTKKLKTQTGGSSYTFNTDSQIGGLPEVIPVKTCNTVMNGGGFAPNPFKEPIGGLSEIETVPDCPMEGQSLYGGGFAPNPFKEPVGGLSEIETIPDCPTKGTSLYGGCLTCGGMMKKMKKKSKSQSVKKRFKKSKNSNKRNRNVKRKRNNKSKKLSNKNKRN
jgi:hypothetical protein